MKRISVFIIKVVSLSMIALVAEALLPRDTDKKSAFGAKRVIELTLLSALISETF